ncbi:hypothetical protein C8J57DRAFT_1529611 [Mycena rebaudengoi]|nr:hypothetical protein C8J57DRAFT_1529611 [Mycena rebaudengoi]
MPFAHGFSMASCILCSLLHSSSMARTKAQKARQNNLQKARNSLKVTVDSEEVSEEGDIGHLNLDSENSLLHSDRFNNHYQSAADNDDSWDLNLGHELPDVDCDDLPEGPQEPDLDEEIVVAPEITEEKELDAFSQFLFNAQAAAQKAKRAQEAQQKRPRHYSGNAPTKGRRKKIAKDLAEKGFLSVFDFIQTKKNSAAAQNTDLDSLAGDGFSAAHSPADSQSDSESQSGSEDEDEPGTPSAVSQSAEQSPETPDCMDPVNVAHVHLKELLEAMQDGSQILDPTPETATDRSLNQLNHKDFPSLRRAAASLSVKSKDKKLDVFFRARITAMAATLHLYLDSQLSYTWREASMLDSCFSHLKNTPSTNEIQQMLEQANIQKRSISAWTAHHWLKHLDWRFGHRKNGMYVDGHEREDIVAYRTAFVKRWLEQYEPRMVEYDNNGNVKKTPVGYALDGKFKGQPFRLILVTHDESTFYANDRRKVGWISKMEKNKAQPKGEGESIMASEFLTLEWGRLIDGEE